MEVAIGGNSELPQQQHLDIDISAPEIDLAAVEVKKRMTSAIASGFTQLLVSASGMAARLAWVWYC
jgi:hypothetical protein